MLQILRLPTHCFQAFSLALLQSLNVSDLQCSARVILHVRWEEPTESLAVAPVAPPGSEEAVGLMEPEEKRLREEIQR